jgi:hypothetical protein
MTVYDRERYCTRQTLTFGLDSEPLGILISCQDFVWGRLHLDSKLRQITNHDKSFVKLELPRLAQRPDFEIRVGCNSQWSKQIPVRLPLMPWFRFRTSLSEALSVAHPLIDDSWQY